MKRRSIHLFAMAFFLLCAVPGALFAQDDKAKTKEKTKRQQIVITRTGDESGKTVIEIDGDKVKINGKDAADLKDVDVHVNNLRGGGTLSFGGNNNFDFNMDLARPSIWRVDSNRAMLGVVTDGDEKGAEIQSVTKESAADKAGLKKGDIITKIESGKISSRKIETTEDVTDAVRAHKPGDNIGITYLRNGKEQRTSATLGLWKGVNMSTLVAPRVLTDQVWRENLNGRGFQTPPAATLFGPARGPKLGMSVQDTEDGKGVKVLDTDDEGTASRAGVKEGDIITKVDDAPVNSADEIAKLMREKKDQASVKLQVARGGKTQTIDVRIPKKIKTVDL